MTIIRIFSKKKYYFCIELVWRIVTTPNFQRFRYNNTTKKR